MAGEGVVVKKCLVFTPKPAFPIGIFTGESLILSSAICVLYEPTPGILMFINIGLRLAFPIVARGDNLIIDLLNEFGE